MDASRVINLVFDLLWLSMALSFAGAGLMLFLIFGIISLFYLCKLIFGCFFRVINLEFDYLWVIFGTKLNRGRSNAIFEFIGIKSLIFEDFLHKYLKNYRFYTKKKIKNSTTPNPTKLSSKDKN